MANYKEMNVCNLSITDTENTSKYVVVKEGETKKFNLPKDKHAPDWSYVNTDGSKVDFICQNTLEDKPN